METITVTGQCFYPDGNPAGSVELIFELLTDVAISEGHSIPTTIPVTTETDGTFSVDLVHVGPDTLMYRYQRPFGDDLYFHFNEDSPSSLESLIVGSTKVSDPTNTLQWFLDNFEPPTDFTTGLTIAVPTATTTGLSIQSTDDDPTNHILVAKNSIGSELLSVGGDGAVKFANAYTFPSSDGTADYVLTTDGSGNLSWSAGAASPLTLAGPTATTTMLTLQTTDDSTALPIFVAKSAAGTALVSVEADGNLIFDPDTAGGSGSAYISSSGDHRIQLRFSGWSAGLYNSQGVYWNFYTSGTLGNSYMQGLSQGHHTKIQTAGRFAQIYKASGGGHASLIIGGTEEYVGNNAPNSSLYINTDTTTAVGLVVDNPTLTTSHIAEFQEDGTTSVYIDTDGVIGKGTSSEYITLGYVGPTGQGGVALHYGLAPNGIALSRYGFHPVVNGQGTQLGLSAGFTAHSFARYWQGLGLDGNIFFAKPGGVSGSTHSLGYSADGLTITNNETAMSGLIVNNENSVTNNVQEWRVAGVTNAHIRPDGRLQSNALHTNAIYTSQNFYSAYFGNSRVAVANEFGIGHGTNSPANPRHFFTSLSTTSFKITTNGTLDTLATFANSGAAITVTPPNTTTVGLVVKAQPLHTANLQEWQSDLGTVLGKMTQGGQLWSKSMYVSGAGNSGYLEFVQDGTASNWNISSGNTGSNSLTLLSGGTGSIILKSNGTKLIVNTSAINATIPLAISLDGPETIPSDTLLYLRHATAPMIRLYNEAAGVNRKSYSISLDGTGSNTKLTFQTWQDSETVKNLNQTTTMDVDSNWVFGGSITADSLSLAGDLLVGTGRKIGWDVNNYMLATGGLVEIRGSDPIVLYDSGLPTAAFRSDGVGYGTKLYSNSTTVPTLIVRSTTSQTSNIQEWQDSAGTPLSRVNSDGSLVAPAGSTATTGIRFSNGDANDGIYAPANGQIGIVSNGAPSAIFYSGKVGIWGSSGSLATPSIFFQNDYDNGLLYNTTNTWGFVAGGVQTITLTSTAITAALPLTLSGNAISNYGENVASASSTAGAISFDATVANHYNVTLTENITSTSISWPTVANASSFTVTYTQDPTGGHTVSFTGFKAANSTPPTISTAANSESRVTYFTEDGGTTKCVSPLGDTWGTI